MTLDPRKHAVRRDLADIRLAGQVFAPHFAAPLPCRLTGAAQLRDAPGGESRAELAEGDLFEVLELAGDSAWGCAPGVGLVGYVDRRSLGLT